MFPTFLFPFPLGSPFVVSLSLHSFFCVRHEPLSSHVGSPITFRKRISHDRSRKEENVFSPNVQISVTGYEHSAARGMNLTGTKLLGNGTTEISRNKMRMQDSCFERARGDANRILARKISTDCRSSSENCPSEVGFVDAFNTYVGTQGGPLSQIWSLTLLLVGKKAGCARCGGGGSGGYEVTRMRHKHPSLHRWHQSSNRASSSFLLISTPCLMQGWEWPQSLR